MSVVFISNPSKSTVENGKLSEKFLQNFATYHRIFPEFVFISPMVNGYSVLPYLQNTDGTWKTWGKYCEKMMKACDEVWVMQFDGWDTSEGVTAEIALAKSMGKKLVYMRPNA